MCGICGFIGKKNISKYELKEMNDTMYHRGPNDSGEEVYALNGEFFLGLAQRRLSIMDLSLLGHQPMHSQNGRISLVFNGEIYNFMQLREELKGYPFISKCDTEVIIAAYLKWGIGCVNRFNGMFAIALYDRDCDTLFLLRDRMGKKPLYYWLDGENMMFASELKPIMKYKCFDKQLRTDILPRYLYHQYINAPDTIFQNVYKLEPGACLAYHNGMVKNWKYWDVAEVHERCKKNLISDYDEALYEFKTTLEYSVRLRMISDVPVGTFLSGGYDSSLITAIAQNMSDIPVKSFAIGFDDEEYNEARYAKQVAECLGTDHTELYIGEKEMLDLVDSIPQYYDEPFADSSQIPSMLVAKLAKENVTVALSGDGGDELFCGYHTYTYVDAAQKLDRLGALTYQACKLFGGCQSKLYKRLPDSVRIIAENRGGETKTQFALSQYLDCVGLMVSNHDNIKSVRYPIESKYHEKCWQETRMLLDMDTYLPGDILCKVDRATMKYSLEARCPILDKDVVEFSYRIPHQFKYKKGDKKRILKDLAYQYIPRELLDRQKKGFSVPLDKWLKGPLKEQLLNYSAKDYIKNQGIFNDHYVFQLVRDYLEPSGGISENRYNYSKFIWSFLVFQKWYDFWYRK